MVTPDYIDISEIRRRCGRNGKPLNPSTVWRWMLDGVGPNKVKLWHLRLGGRYVTTLEALDAFLAALNPGATAAPARTPAAKRRAAARAGKELEALGV